MMETVKPYWARFRNWWTLPRALGVIALLFGFFGTIRGPIPYIPGITTFYWAIGPELIGIGLTVLIIDYAYEQRQQDQLREQLKRDLLSGVRDFAVRALDELEHKCWLDEVLKEKKSSLYRVQWEGAILFGVHLESADLRHAHLEGAILVEAHLENADLRKAHLEGADMTLAHLEGANLALAHLKNADLGKAHLMEANLTLADLEGASLALAHLEGADLQGTHLEGADLQGANFKGVNLWGANLEGADLTLANLERANLRGANLKGTKNISVRMLTKVSNLSGAIMPDGSSPDEWALEFLGRGEITGETFSKIVQLASSEEEEE